MTNHHLIPEEIMKAPEFRNLFENAKRSGFDGDGASNGIFLPGNQSMAEKIRLPGHWSNHASYTDFINSKVFKLSDMYNTCKLSDTQVVLGLGKIQAEA